MNEFLIEENNKIRIFHKYNNKHFDNRKDPLTKNNYFKIVL